MLGSISRSVVHMLCACALFGMHRVLFDVYPCLVCNVYFLMCTLAPTSAWRPVSCVMCCVSCDMGVVCTCYVYFVIGVCVCVCCVSSVLCVLCAVHTI